MTVDEALTSLKQMVDMGWIPNPEPVEVIRRYVEGVREVEQYQCEDDYGNIYLPEDAVRRLAAAREGRHD